jgi:hypothetical protein
MGLFNKGFGEKAVLLSIFKTFAQAINACEKGNDIELKEVWDIFINSAGWITDGGLLTELECETLVYSTDFPENHSLTLDLIKIRNNLTSIQKFIDYNKRTIEIKWSPKGLGDVQLLNPEYFANEFTALAKDSFPNFRESSQDSAFIAVLAIFTLTIILDSENYSGSNKTFLRVTAFEFALRWLAEWNHA